MGVVTLKKTNYLELFLFMVCVIFVIVGVFNLGSILSSVSDILVPMDNYGSEYDSKRYALKSLITNVPMLIISLTSIYFAFKHALKIRKEDRTDRLENQENTQEQSKEQ